MLLIVPYGIETDLQHTEGDYEVLLIVPYGIETLMTAKYILKPQRLLIVPYGIETLRWEGMVSGLNLLIVPYGIETRHSLHDFTPSPAF